jgi:hypothetical protein
MDKTSAYLLFCTGPVGNEDTAVVLQRNLLVRSRWPGHNEQHPQACLHRGFSRRVDQIDHPPCLGNSAEPGMSGDVRLDIGDADRASVKSHIYRDDSLHQREVPGEVEHSS